MLRIYKVVAILLIILGIVHCSMVFIYFESLTGEALFSIGTGIAVTFLGLLNFSAVKLLTPFLLTLAVIANIIQTFYGILSLKLMNDIPTYFGILIFLLALILSWIVRIQTINSK